MKIAEMQEKQMKLDHYIAEKHKLGFAYAEKHREGTKLALLVELGEMANATRIFKTWSNKGSEPKERILDEIADCIHFMLRLMNFDEVPTTEEFMFPISEKFNEWSNSRTLIQIITTMYSRILDEEWMEFYYGLVAICIKLGYTRSEVEAAYLKKYEENFKRQENGY